MGGDEGGAAGTVKMEYSLDVAFDDNFGGHVEPAK
jgi:hypothetical protein